MDKDANKRRHLRYPPDPGWVARIIFAEREVPALIIDESRSGCQLLLKDSDSEFGPVSDCKVQIGKLGPYRAELRWQDKVDDFVKVGIRFLE